MNIKTFIGAVIVAIIIIPLSGALFARENIPETPIDLVLDRDIELQLTDIQVNKLVLFNKDIVNRIIPLQARIEIGKKALCNFNSRWVKAEILPDENIIVEYYKNLAELESLKLEAIMKIRAILTIKQFILLTESLAPELKSLQLDCFSFCN